VSLPVAIHSDHRLPRQLTTLSLATVGAADDPAMFHRGLDRAHRRGCGREPASTRMRVSGPVLGSHIPGSWRLLVEITRV